MIRQARYADFLSFYRGRLPAYVLERDGVVVACGGIMERDGRAWGWFDVKGKVSRSEALTLMRKMRAFLKEWGEELYIVCDEQFATAPKLLRLQGFEPTEETYNGSRIWKCQA